MSNSENHENRDPITGAPGAHPIGTGLGAAAGGIAGGAIAGTLVAGPAGTLVGAVAGAVLGGLGGKAAAELADPTIVDDHWRDKYQSEAYYRPDMTFEDYAPAYRLGAQSRARNSEASFEQSEAELAQQYAVLRGHSRLDWEYAKHAALAEWNRHNH